MYFDNVRDWNRWQNHFLKEFIFEKITKKYQEIILEDEIVDLLEGGFSKPFVHIGNESLGLNHCILPFLKIKNINLN